jgi:competence protein ComEC
MRRRLGAFFRLNLLLGAALAAVAGVCGGRASLEAALLVALALGLIGAWLAGWRGAVLAATISLVASASFTKRERDRIEGWNVLRQYSAPVLSGHLGADGRANEGGWTGKVKLERREGIPAATVWWVGSGECPVAGARVEARGRLEAAQTPRNPGEFDQRSWFEQQGISAAFIAERSGGKVTTGRFAEIAFKVRRKFRESVTFGLPPDSEEAQVIRAVVMGEYPRDGEELVAAYRDSGALHAFSVSGMHVAMVGLIGWWALGAFGLSRRTAVPVLIALMFGYSWISGNSPPAVRAAWMGAMFLLAFTLRRKPSLLNALGAVLLVTMLWNGRLLLLPGVQLSYGVVGMIGLFGDRVSRIIGRRFRPDPYLPRVLLSRRQEMWYSLLQKGCSSVAVAMVAWVGSTPLTLWHFGMTTPVAVLGAIPMTLGILFLMVSALMAAVIYPFMPALAATVNLATGQLAALCTGTARGLTEIPYGQLQFSSEPTPFVLVFDLEQGAGAACFATDEGDVLLDCGDRRSFRRTVWPALRRLGVSPDAVVLSHPEAGHVGGGEELLERANIEQVLLPVSRSRSAVYNKWLSGAPAAGAQLFLAEPGTILPFPDGAQLEVVWAPENESISGSADDRVAIYRLHWSGWKILFVNDAGAAIEDRLVASGVDLSADVLVAGGHRGGPSLGDAFIRRANPKAIVAANATFPPSEKLDPAKIRWWQEQGILVLDQAKSGAVTIRPESGGALVIKGFLDPLPVRLMPQ